MYDIYIDDMLLPINPEKITTKINGKNQTSTLINDGEVSILKKPGLTDISFDVLFPNSRYPFIHYADGVKTFHDSKYYLDKLETLMSGMIPFQFIVVRRFPTNKNIFSTNISCVLENYHVIDDAKEGFDIKVQITLKQYKPYSAKTFNVDVPSARAPIVVNAERGASTSSKKNKKNRGGKGGSGSGTKTYKVVIPGMSTISVTAASVQDAIIKVAGTWTGDIMVDGTTYYVVKGKITDKAAAKATAKVKKAISTVATGVKKTAQTISSVINKLTSIRKRTVISKAVTKNQSGKMKLTR